MSVATVNHETLSTQLGREIPEFIVVVAKHRVAGLSAESLAEMIGCPVSDIEQLESQPDYIEVRGILGAMIATEAADQGILWDSIESTASRKLLQKVEIGKLDASELLSIAATANRMQRRNAPARGGLLDPARAPKKIGLTLTRRMVEQMMNDGTRTIATEEQLSISDGSMQNPSFDEVKEMMGVGLNPGPVTKPDDSKLLRDMGLDG